LLPKRKNVANQLNNVLKNFHRNTKVVIYTCSSNFNLAAVAEEKSTSSGARLVFPLYSFSSCSAFCNHTNGKENKDHVISFAKFIVETALED